LREASGRSATHYRNLTRGARADVFEEGHNRGGVNSLAGNLCEPRGFSLRSLFRSFDPRKLGRKYLKSLGGLARGDPLLTVKRVVLDGKNIVTCLGARRKNR